MSCLCGNPLPAHNAILCADAARAPCLPVASGITSTLAWTLLNSGIALIGYYFSAWLIDDINWGRYRIQVR